MIEADKKAPALNEGRDESLVDRTYEAAFVANAWRSVLSGHGAEAAFASIAAFNGTVLRWTGARPQLP